MFMLKVSPFASAARVRKASGASRAGVFALVALVGMQILAGCGSQNTESSTGGSAGSSATPVATTGTATDTSSDAGAGAATGSQSGVQEITIVAKDNLFDPKSYTLTAGGPVRIVARNDGQNVHEVEVKGLMPESKLSPGQTKSLDIQALQPGTYKIYCEIHEDQGMEGELVVK